MSDADTRGGQARDEGTSIHVPAEVVARLRAARRVFALTGAGISAESGLATFRAPGSGLWSQYDPADVATPQAWARNPRLVWSWYAYRRAQARRAQPNAGHLALAQLEARTPEFTLATQNVDGLHARAGSQRLAELHGSLFRFRCSAEGTEVAWDDAAERELMAGNEEEREVLVDPPACPRCGALVRPDIVWFGEKLPLPPFERAARAAQECEVCLVVGTSALVYPAAALPMAALSREAYLIEINPEATTLTSYAGWAPLAAAGEALPALLRALEGGER